MSCSRPRVIAQERFLEHQQELTRLPLHQRFDYIYRHNLWGAEESRSGLGSTLAETAVLRHRIVHLLATLQAHSLLDIPCGDFHWLSQVDLGVSYLGADIVESIVLSNARRFTSPSRSFLHLDLTATNPSTPLPQADVILCRDCLVHLSYANIRKALANIRRSSARFLLMTHFFDIDRNHDIADGDWRPLNFQLDPFSLPPPAELLIEGCVEAGGAYRDKTLALWPVSALPE